MNINKIYGNYIPKINNYVNFIFTERNNNVLICNLIDYNLDAIMPYNLVTTKKKIRSINKLTPLNKKLIGFIDNIDNNIITLSLAYNDIDSINYKKIKEDNIYINQLKKKISQYCFSNKINIQIFLKKYIYPIDEERIKNNSKDNLYDYIINNINTINENTFKKYLLESHKEYIKTSSNFYETKFKFISVGGIEYTKSIFTKILEKYINLNIDLISVPEYRIYSEEKYKDLHIEVINYLKMLSISYKPQIFIK